MRNIDPRWFEPIAMFIICIPFMIGGVYNMINQANVRAKNKIKAEQVEQWNNSQESAMRWGQLVSSANNSNSVEVHLKALASDPIFYQQYTSFCANTLIEIVKNDPQINSQDAFALNRKWPSFYLMWIMNEAFDRNIPAILKKYPNNPALTTCANNSRTSLPKIRAWCKEHFNGKTPDEVSDTFTSILESDPPDEEITAFHCLAFVRLKLQI